MSADPARGAVRECSTAEVPPARAFEYWCDLICDTFVQLSAAPTTPGPFSGALRLVDLPGVQVTTVRSTGQRVRRTRRLIARTSEDYLLASIQVTGRGRVEQDGRVAHLRPGSMAFYDSTRPYALHFDDAFEQTVVQVPRQRLLAAAGVRDEAVHNTAVPLAPEGPGSVVAGFFTGLALLQRRDPAGAALLSPHADGLLATALRLTSGVGPVPEDRVLAREAVARHLRERFADPRLDVDSVAAACCLSRRALFRLFEGEPAGLTTVLRRIRVEHAQRLLTTQPRRPVAGVGTACGFAGEAQFHRAFRAVTGQTPAEYRAAARTGATGQ
ncbi:helix-turn-helix domain-containing protein [Geodermatophilus sp. CPCC 206100]|uniref:AraC-like ligand-binding domain-containing protein n=1 Tax=Geodermatophilus sp. CPCC 206100 TaxID=3020054 RepID=UPI003B000D53